MPTPTLVTVNGDFTPEADVDQILFTVPDLVRYNAGPDVVVPHTVTVDVGADGTWTVQLYGTNDPAWSPSNWNYKVTLVGQNLIDTFYIQVPYDAGTINFSALLPSLTPSQGSLYAAFNHTHEGGGGSGPSPASSVQSSTSFGQAAAVGAATSYARGDHVHGTPSLGTTGTTAAAGNHNHSGVYDPAGTASSAVTTHVGLSDPHSQYALESDVTTSLAGKANTSHTHAAADVNSGTLDIARVPTGTSGTTVALGNHTHTATGISDSTAVGRSVLTAADAAAARAAIGAGTSDLALGSTGSTAAAGNHTHGGGGGATITRSTGYVTSGDITPQNTAGAWALLTGGPTFSIAAVVGDRVEFHWACLMERNLSTFYDTCVIVSSAAVIYAATGTSTPAVEGDPGYYPDVPSYIGHAGPFAFTVTAPMISGGNVTIGFAVKSGGAGKLFAGAAFPLRYSLTNFGQ